MNGFAVRRWISHLTAHCPALQRKEQNQVPGLVQPAAEPWPDEDSVSGVGESERPFVLKGVVPPTGKEEERVQVTLT